MGGGEALRIVDLFCGCGGMTLGVEEAARRAGRNPEVAWAIDNNEHAVSVFGKTRSVANDRLVKGDILDQFSRTPSGENTPSEKKLRRSIGEVDILVAGPPCQGHSDLNNSTRRNDPRNKLYLTALRAARVLKPAAIIIENVSTVVHAKNKAIPKSLKLLDELGYTTTVIQTLCSDYGLPQMRKRHLLVATKLAALSPARYLASYHTPKPASVMQFIGDLETMQPEETDIFNTASKMTQENQDRVKTLFQNEWYDLPNEYRPPCHQHGQHSYKSMYGRLHPNRPAQTVTTGFGSMGQGRFVHPTKQRVVTPHEAARLQGLPDFLPLNLIGHRTGLHRLIGNTVPPRLIAMIVAGLIEDGVI